ncbi:related to acetylxylan esterase [Phialocephala subalpina]|uniref:Related to acetylxylan esterase n=1 Tax=Phialocephala subalpina TaxID=576137 RepID=A0A1L7XBV0_9HELO|nr:related to acetylxylan esterase [Phialocephala subalpina]
MYTSKMNLLLAVTCLLGSVLAQTKLKVMPLGDSITEITCWRSIVWDNLTAAGLADKIQFVGSSTTNTQNCKASTATWDHHHEGHSGFLAIDIANKYLTGWLASAKPDVVMFMLGTNDVNGRHSTTDIMAAYTKMVQEMRAINPAMKIIVDLVIPLPSSNAGITAINNAIPDWIKTTTTAASPIVMADCNTGFPSTDLRDGVHPNLAGDAIIASRLTPVLISVIKSALNITTA